MMAHSKKYGIGFGISFLCDRRHGNLRFNRHVEYLVSATSDNAGYDTAEKFCAELWDRDLNFLCLSCNLSYGYNTGTKIACKPK